MAERELRNQVVVITGASSGFGKGAALQFAREGARVVLGARRADLIQQLAAECNAEGGEAIAVPTDVSKREDVERLAAAALSAFGRIDVWVNNAGVGAIGAFERIPLEVHEQLIHTNVLGVLYGSYLAYRQFLAQGSGVLINIASELGFGSVPYFSSYTAAKHAVTGLSDSLRQEVKQNNLNGIHICTIMPTAHDTPFFEHAANYSDHEIVPPKPLHDPQDVVDAIVRVARKPEDKEIVGADGVVKLIAANLMPAVSEKMGASQMHRNIKKAPPSGDTPGAVLTPVTEGTEVSAGNRQKGGKGSDREERRP
ncbi:MAG TPA: SDR family oxidoreductase [Thermoanaerobaculia bacterium]|nr:SDR family oxidoreductase [Thermoanaerobaculia bacterium]